MSDARVDLAELTPEDRERVLRLLFAKINNMDLRPVTQTAPQPPQAPPQQQQATPQASEGKGGEEGGDGFGLTSPFGLAAELPPDVQYRIRRGDAAAAADEEIDTSTLAAALGAAAQERVIFSQQAAEKQER